MWNRGSLVTRTAEADDIASQRIAALRDAMDGYADTGPSGQGPFGGGRLKRNDFATLLAGNEGAQREVLARLPYATDQEKDALRRMLQQSGM